MLVQQRTPKHCPELEKRILSWLIAKGDPNDLSVINIFLKIDSNCFYSSEAKHIFALIRKFFDSKESFDEVKILDLLRNSSDTVFDYLKESILTEFCTSISEENIDTLLLYATLRQKIDLLNAVNYQMQEEVDPNECLKIIENITDKLVSIKLTKECGITSEKAVEFFSQQNFTDETVPTRLNSIDLPLDGGFKNRSLITIAGDSGVGKTYFGVYLLMQLSQSFINKQALFFSFEMPYYQIFKRYLSLLKNKNFDFMTDEEKSSILSFAAKIPLTFYEEKYRYIDEIENISRGVTLKKPISVIVIDYLSLVKAKGKYDRHDLMVSEITQRLAALAMQLECIIICLSQVNRMASQRSKSDRCPYPADVADSIGSFRASSLWLGIDRPELYMPDDFDAKNKFVVKCRKNRDGQLFEAVFDFNNGLFRESSDRRILTRKSLTSSEKIRGFTGFKEYKDR